MNNKNPFISILIVILAIAAFVMILRRHVSAPQPEMADPNMNPSFTFNCTDGKYITAAFHLPEDGTVSIALSDGRTMELAHVVSASGARYANTDESFVFWNKGTSAFIEETGVTTYDNCTATLPE